MGSAFQSLDWQRGLVRVVSLHVMHCKFVNIVIRLYVAVIVSHRNDWYLTVRLHRLKLRSWVLQGARHPDGLTDQPSVVKWLGLAEWLLASQKWLFHGVYFVIVPVLFVTEHHTMKAYWGSGSIAPRILDLGTIWTWVFSFTPQPLYPQGKNLWYPLDRRLGGPQSRSGRGGEEKNSQPLPGLESPIIQSVAQRFTTELSLAWCLIK
jgi:hypothetical protein